MSYYHSKKVKLSDLDFLEVEEDEAIEEEQLANHQEYIVKMSAPGVAQEGTGVLDSKFRGCG